MDTMSAVVHTLLVKSYFLENVSNPLIGLMTVMKIYLNVIDQNCCLSDSKSHSCESLTQNGYRHSYTL